MNENAASAFEQSFLNVDLADQVAECDRYELAPLLLELFRDSQPVLEAGCGSGRWCAWLGAHGISADGIDWSQALCDRAAREIPGSRFFARDMSDSGLPDASYGGLLALGSIEHTACGPAAALTEFHRILRPGGMAVITVPYGGRLRLTSRAFHQPVESAKASSVVRRLARKPPLADHARTRREAARGTVPAWHPHWSLGPEGWSFYEYEFNRDQFESFLTEAGFTIQTRFVAFTDEGLFHTFGRLAGRWDTQESRVRLTPVGRALHRVLPASTVGHMLCAVVRK